MYIMVNFINYHKHGFFVIEMKYSVKYSFALAVILLLFAGCQKQGPVELVDNDLQSQALEVENTPITYDPSDSGIQDSTEIFPTSTKMYYGKLVIAGSEFYGPSEHHEASLAQARFYNKTQPIVVNGDTIAFRTIDAGNISIDNLLLHSVVRTVTQSGMVVDTIGIQYLLLNRDGIGGAGFQFYGNHRFQWDITGAGSFPGVSETIVSPPKLHITSPTPEYIVSLSRNLRVRWDGGGTRVKIEICDVQAGHNSKPLVRMRLRNNHGGVVIPSNVLRLLPRGRNKFLFTFSTENSFVTHIASFENDILVQAVYSHNLLLQIRE